MADLNSKVKSAIDEARILVLGSQVLLGFQYRGFFEPRFEKLGAVDRHLKFAALLLLLVTLLLVMLPAARHRIVELGENTRGMLRFTVRCLELALLPLAVAMGLDFALAGAMVLGATAGIGIGCAVSLLALALWYGVVVLRRSDPPREEEMEKQELGQKILEVLTETRMVLPGAQAMLGFQLAMMMVESFEKLPQSSKVLHLTSLCLVGASTLFLMAPAAFHRIVERGEDTERFHSFATAMVLLAMGTLAPAFAIELAIVTRKLTGETGPAVLAGVAALACFYGAWFGLTLVLRARARRPA